MLILGQVLSGKERYELRFVAQVFKVEERLRYLTRKQRKK